jgi:hypothetical protein
VRQRTGSFTPTVEDAALTGALAPPGFEPDVAEFGRLFLPAFNTRFWGSFGWYSVRLSDWAAWVATALVVGALASALATRRTPGAARGSEPAGRLATSWFLVPLAALAVLVVGRSWSIYTTTSKLVFAQGRYLFAGLTALAVPVAMGVRRGAARWTPFVFVAVAVVAQAHALRRSYVDYWGGPGLGPRGQARALAAYSGWPGEVVVALALGAALAAMVLAWTLVGLARNDPDRMGETQEGRGLAVGSGAP